MRGPLKEVFFSLIPSFRISPSESLNYLVATLCYLLFSAYVYVNVYLITKWWYVTHSFNILDRYCNLVWLFCHNKRVLCQIDKVTNGENLLKWIWISVCRESFNTSIAIKPFQNYINLLILFLYVNNWYCYEQVQLILTFNPMDILQPITVTLDRLTTAVVAGCSLTMSAAGLTGYCEVRSLN